MTMNYEIEKSVFGSTWTGAKWFNSMTSICRASSVQGRMELKRRRTNELFSESKMALPSVSAHAFSIGSRVKCPSHVPTGQIQIAINRSYQRVNRNKMPHGVVAGWFSHLAQFKTNTKWLMGQVQCVRKQKCVRISIRQSTHSMQFICHERGK